MKVEQAVETFSAFGQFNDIAFEAFGDGVEEAPHRSGRKRFVPGFPPFRQNVRDELIWTHPYVTRSNHEIVSHCVVEVGQLVGRYATVLMVPAVHEAAYRSLNQVGQIPPNESGMFSGEFDLSRKRQVIADENLGTSGYPGGEGLVVRVPDTEDPAIIRIGF